HASRSGGYVLTANARYFRGPPRVQRVRVPFIGDADETFEALKQRRIDMVPLSLPRENAVDLDRSLGIAVRRGPWYVGTALVLNTRRAPFDDPALRRAVSQALDLRLIVRNVAPAEPALRGFVHPRSRWRADTQVHEPDPEAARRALAALDPPPIRLLSPENDPVRSEAARQVALALRRAGATVSVVDRSPDQLSRAIGEDGATPDFDAAVTSTTPLVSRDPNYLRAMFGSDPQTATLNVTGYRSDEFDAAAQRVAGARVPGVRRRAITEELRLLAAAAPAIPLFFSQGAFAFRNEIYGGWAFVRGTGIFDKRSFLAATPPARPGAPAATTVIEEEGDGGLDVVNVISLVLLGGLVVLAVYALLQRRRS
ncbi:MAG TPA: ABC transporter substrate-binding protein, partial [Solirubrobacteraceae bacterium]|nr:ABC transporter substrate-binding protein [Solirubrobacteraceae bacterium]